MKAPSSPACARLALTFFLTAAAAHAASFFGPGDVVRVAKGEMLQFQGKNFLPAPKGQEFTVLQYQAAQNVAYVGYYKEDGSLIAVAIPAPALEAAPPNAWSDLLRGVEAFRGLRTDEARRLIMRAGQDPEHRTLATGISARLTGYAAALAQGTAGRQSLGAVMLGLRETAANLAKDGYLCLALPLDEATDRALAQLYGANPVDPAFATKLDRADVAKKVATSQRCVARARQAVSLKRLSEARKMIEEGLEAEPNRPELKAFQAKTAKDLKEADDDYEAADRMRRFPNGTPHALTALANGLKACADHPKLLALKARCRARWRNAPPPPITPALLTKAASKGPAAPLEEGRKLYTTRCSECHDLELLDSRSVGGWEKMVGNMSGRAKLTEKEKAHIMDYITVAWNGMSGG